MVERVNKVRAKHGLPALRRSRSLSRSSRRYARIMMRRDQFGHSSRIHASPRFRRLGEALSYHRGSRLRIRMTVRGWLHSPSHRALLLSRSFRWLGAGRSAGRFGSRRSTVWVLQLGRR